MKRKRDILKKYSFLINIIIKISKIIPQFFYKRLLKFLRKYDNYFVIFLRYICLKNLAKKCGDNVAVFSNVYLHNVQNLEIGNNVSIHPLSYIEASGGIKIGNDVSIAHNCTIMSEEHVYSDLNKNIKDQGVIFKETIIEDNVWIGSGTRILGGTTIRSGSIVAAGAVVKNEVPHNVIVGGVPAKVIKQRG